uniref:Signal peptidase complex catalytic subunit SEC11 n=1 Tax=Kahliella matisi TaxID=479472 RepID=B8X446_9STIC|nr:putative signal peptidase I family protein [Kahliella matisi]
MIWKTLMVVTNTESPVVVVLSGSMEPSYYRGDILFLMRKEKIETGDIIVYQIENEAIPIVHRVITVQNAPYVGMLTIWLNDYPTLKWAVIGLMFITVLVSKDPS